MLRITDIREAVPDLTQQPDAHPRDCRIFDSAPFGSSGSKWATVFEVFLEWKSTSWISRMLDHGPDPLGYIFLIRIASPDFVENDPRFTSDRSLRFDTFTESEVITSIKKIIGGAPARSIRRSFDYLEENFYLDDPDLD